MAGKAKVVYACQHCGNESPKWLGHCPACDQWNSYVEKVVSSSPLSPRLTANPPQELPEISLQAFPRLLLPQSEFNRVLGGGVVPGSLTLIGGDPGIGKSTLLLQVAAGVAGENRKVLYCSGEESLPQLKLRAERLGLSGRGLYLLAETNLEGILGQATEMAPALLIIDSIQAVFLEGVPAAAGSLGQVREGTMRLMPWAKAHHVPVFLTGHVTKEGALAGPKALEHIVDVVLYLEGEPYNAYRLLRSVKNRFGSTHEVGVFEMGDWGLVEVANPSLAFLGERSVETVGAVVVPTLEGTRPLLVEIQALTSPTPYGQPRRTANGVDFNRLLLLTAVLSRRAGMLLGQQDVLVNVAGGLKVEEPAADLGIALAIASSFREAPIEKSLMVLGEVGLSGELRPVSQIERRLAEGAKLGFKSCLLPNPALERVAPLPGLELRGAGTLAEALGIALPRERHGPGKRRPFPVSQEENLFGVER